MAVKNRFLVAVVGALRSQASYACIHVYMSNKQSKTALQTNKANSASKQQKPNSKCT